MSIPSDSSLPTENPNRISYSSPPPPPSNPIAQQTEDKSGLPVVRDAEQTRLPVIQTSSEDSERPPSAQRVKTDDDTETLDSSEDMEPDEEVGPAEKVADFDWHALHQRYHDAINKCQEDEASLALEWQSLMNYFKVWAEAGHLQETERTYSRFRTRMANVQHSEETLEKTRTHYVNVVTAFENALSLLRDQTFPG